jgi:lipopolysaccharide transport system ATP-binding protein
MTDEIAIRVNGLGKKYRISHETAAYKTLGETITNTIKRPVRRLRRTATQKSSEDFWALKDTSFEVKRGDVIGIIGRNGAGKSTLLKILSRITTPTKGTVEVHGRIGSLLEVGTGFHPELSGRENIYLSGSILGMKRSEIDEKFDEIVKFAEMEKFLDTPVKRYSSGMYVRLAFAVAAHLEPDILIIDEVLAVGDAAFQKKCLGKMGDVAKEGRTVLFVSHNMNAIRSLCGRVILIQNGNILFDGETDIGIDVYFNESMEIGKKSPIAERIRDKKLSLEAKIIDVNIINEEGSSFIEIDSTKQFSIQLIVQVYSEISFSPQINIQKNGQNILLFSSELMKNKLFHLNCGIYTITCTIDPCFLSASDYYITCGLVHKKTEWIDFISDALLLTIRNSDMFSTCFNLEFKNSVFYAHHHWDLIRNEEGKND